MKNKILDDFYSEISSTYSTPSQDEFKCQIKLNHLHPIYRGHFDGFPVTPGVCLIQIIKELLMDKLQKDLFMTSGDTIKFLIMINPETTSDFDVAFVVKNNTSSLDVSAVFSHENTAYMKFKGSFKILE